MTNLRSLNLTTSTASCHVWPWKRYYNIQGRPNAGKSLDYATLGLLTQRESVPCFFSNVLCAFMCGYLIVAHAVGGAVYEPTIHGRTDASDRECLTIHIHGNSQYAGVICISLLVLFIHMPRSVDRRRQLNIESVPKQATSSPDRRTGQTYTSARDPMFRLVAA